MAVRSLEARVRKLEAVHKPGGLFFLVWGRDLAEAQTKVRKCMDEGAIGGDDRVVCGAWPNGVPPQPRWVAAGESLMGQEFNLICEVVKQAFPNARELEDRESRADLTTYSNTGLVAIALGRPASTIEVAAVN